MNMINVYQITICESTSTISLYHDTILLVVDQRNYWNVFMCFFKSSQQVLWCCYMMVSGEGTIRV